MDLHVIDMCSSEHHRVVFNQFYFNFSYIHMHTIFPLHLTYVYRGGAYNWGIIKRVLKQCCPQRSI
jgi:hypothetical protein